MTGWTLTQLTFGSDESRFHAHSYYDIPVMDASGASLVGFRTDFTERQPRPGDTVEIGVVETATPGSWRKIGTSGAWSWQQGPMAQFVPGRDLLVWNDREGDGFAARLHAPDGARVASLARPIYALMPDGSAGLSVDMGRLDVLRPGYGYATGDRPVPARTKRDDGVWHVPLDGGEPELILPLARAVSFLFRHLRIKEKARHLLKRYHYWFNHVKIAPGGKRFTVKLRWRNPEGVWGGRMGVSLTCGTDGRDLRLLAGATSHVIWLDDERLYFYDERGRDIPLYRDAAPRGARIGRIAEGQAEGNVHLRHLPPEPPPPGAMPPAYVFDTPYREEVELYELADGARHRIASFSGHVPRDGPFRCDLHPCPDASGRHLAVTSLQDGGRQIYLLTRED